MKKWRQYSLLFLLLLSACLLTAAGYAGKNTIYAGYSRQNGWMTPELSLVFQGWKDGVGPWDLFTGALRTQAEPGTAGAEAQQPAADGLKDGMPGGGDADAASDEPGSTGAEEPGPSGALSGNSVPGDGVSQNGASQSGTPGDGVSQNGTQQGGVSQNGTPQDGASQNGVSQNTVSENAVSQNAASPENSSENRTPQDGASEVAFTTADGRQYDQFGRLIGQETKETQAEPEKEESPSEEAAPAGAALEETAPAETEPEQEDQKPQESGTQGTAPQKEKPEEEKPQETYSFVPVPEGYFDDALFIGDSRTVGLDEYGGFSESTTFFAKTSLTIYDLFEEPEKFARLADGKKATLEEALTERKFGKIYIMLGINELGRGTTESFFQVYADAVNRIRMLQPDALIFIQGIMRVGEEKNSTDAVFNNANINARNQAISMMADNRSIFYLEINDAVCDETGNLISDYTFDQIHLKAKYYQLWKDYLLAHGILRN